MQPGKALVVCIGSIALAPGSAWAEGAGARALGRGGAFRADPGDAAAAPINLAAVATEPRYDVYGGVGFGPDSLFDLRAGAVDSRTSPVTLAAGYRRTTDDVVPTGDALPGWKLPDEELDNPTRHEGVHLGLAAPLLNRRLAIAAVTRYDWRESQELGKDSAFNVGVSVAGKPVPTLTVAVGARDLIDVGYPDTARTGDLAVRWDLGPYVGLAGDVVTPLDADWAFGRLGWHAGADASLIDWLTLRAGYARDGGENEVGAGLGIVSKKATLDYGARVALGDDLRSWHAIDVRVLF